MRQHASGMLYSRIGVVVMSQETIVAKALRCIDEVYPNENTLNEVHFPTDAFIEEMVRWLIVQRLMPFRQLLIVEACQQSLTN